MDIVINNLSNFIECIDNDYDKNRLLCQFSIYKIVNENSCYKRILQEKKLINFNNITELIKKTYNIEPDNEYSLFSIDKEITYDNKTKGGKIMFNLLNIFHNLSNNNINSIQCMFPINDKKISLMQRFFFIFSTLLMIKNYYINNFVVNKNSDCVLNFIKSIEGIILQKNHKCVKLVISFDEDYSDKELSIICNVIKTLLGINPDSTFKYNSYKNIDVSHIIK